MGAHGAAEIPEALGSFLAALSLGLGFNATLVVIGTTLLGLAAGAVGAFMLLRKRALMSDALSHATLPGVALAFLLGVALETDPRALPLLLAGATATSVLGVLAVQGIMRASRIREDAAIGIVLSVFFGAGVVLLSYIQALPQGGQAGLKTFILGQTAAMRVPDAQLIGAVAVCALLVCALLYHPFRLVCFDADYGRVVGLPVTLVDLALMGLIVVVTVIGLKAVGLILVVALVIVPAAAARFWTERLARFVPLSALFGGVAGWIGSALSASLPRLPAGAVIVLVAGAIFILSFLFAPARGVLADAWRRMRLRLVTVRDHFLRAAFEQLEAAGTGAAGSFALAAIAADRGWSERRAGWIARWMATRGLAAHLPDGRMHLTPAGREAAQRVTRAHRLWEQLLLVQGAGRIGQAHRSADLVEHVLSPAMVAALEAELAARGAAAQPMPPAPERSPQP